MVIPPHIPEKAHGVGRVQSDFRGDLSDSPRLGTAVCKKLHDPPEVAAVSVRGKGRCLVVNPCGPVRGILGRHPEQARDDLVQHHLSAELGFFGKLGHPMLHQQHIGQVLVGPLGGDEHLALQHAPQKRWRQPRFLHERKGHMHYVSERARGDLERPMGLRSPKYHQPVGRKKEAVAADDGIDASVLENAQLDFIVPMQALGGVGGPGDLLASAVGQCARIKPPPRRMQACLILGRDLFDKWDSKRMRPESRACCDRGVLASFLGNQPAISHFVVTALHPDVAQCAGCFPRL